MSSGLSEEQTEAGLRYVLWMGLASHAMGTLAGGVFVVKVALSFGASLFVVGLLAALPSLAQLAQLPAAYAVERYRTRRRVALVALLGVRTCIFGLALVPLLLSGAAGLAAVLGLTLLQGVFSASVGSAWNSWLRDLVPQERFGAFFARRQRLTLTLGVPLGLGAGAFVARWADRFPARELQGYSVLFFVGFLAGVVSFLFFLRTPEPRLPAVETRTPFRELLARPFRDDNFRNLVAFFASWNFAVALAGPFFTVFLLQRLGYDMSIVIALSVVSQLTSVAFSGIWGRLSDAFSNKAVLGVSTPLVLVGTLLWLFTAMPDPHAFTLPLLVVIHVVLGMANSGVGLATGNIGMKLAPRGEATPYLVASGVVGSLAAGVAPVVGGLAANFFAPYRLVLSLDWEGPSRLLSVNAFHLQGMDFVFVLSALVGVYAVHRLSLVVEEGEIERSVVVTRLLAEVKRPLLAFSTTGGLSDRFYSPFLPTRPRGEAPRERREDDDGGATRRGG